VAKPLKVHAPSIWFPSEGLCRLWKPGIDGAPGHPVAVPGETVDCRACISVLLDNVQYANQLIAAGYKFHRPIALKRGRKADKRQTDFCWEK